MRIWLEYAGTLAVTIAAGLATVGPAQAEVMFVDGSYAELCSMAAHHPDDYIRIVITGSRLGLAPIEACNRAISGVDLNLDNIPGSYNNRGVLWFAEGNYAQALEDFTEAVRLNSKLAQAHVNQGYTLTAMERWSDSIDAYSKGIALDAEEKAKAYFNRGVAHEELGNITQAWRDYQQAAAIDPAWEAPQLELARFKPVPR